MIKLHPHIKHFIKTIIATELNEAIGPSEKYKWKEGIIQEIQSYLMEHLGEVQTQEDVTRQIDIGMQEFKEKKLEPVLVMISNTLKQIPLDVLKKYQTMMPGK